MPSLRVWCPRKWPYKLKVNWKQEKGFAHGVFILVWRPVSAKAIRPRCPCKQPGDGRRELREGFSAGTENLPPPPRPCRKLLCYCHSALVFGQFCYDSVIAGGKGTHGQAEDRSTQCPLTSTRHLKLSSNERQQQCRAGRTDSWVWKTEHLQLLSKDGEKKKEKKKTAKSGCWVAETLQEHLTPWTLQDFPHSVHWDCPGLESNGAPQTPAFKFTKELRNKAETIIFKGLHFSNQP